MDEKIDKIHRQVERIQLSLVGIIGLLKQTSDDVVLDSEEIYGLSECFGLLNEHLLEIKREVLSLKGDK